MKVNISVYQLRKMYLEKHPNGHYFDYDTLKFFGESISTMSVLKNTCDITDCMGKKHTCYVLSKLSKNYPTGKKRTYGFFDVDTLDDVC